jgi:undecaprenyl-diphosphatase
MDDLLGSALLGLIQGLTEFLPISSTGHLILFEKLLSFHPPGKVFEVVVQLGSALAVCFAYFERLFRPLVRCPSSSADRRFVLTLALATLPAGIAGFLFHHAIKGYLYNSTTVALSLILGGLFFLWLARRSPVVTCTRPEQVLPSQASWVGAAQAVALIPGVSRSGATIASGVLLGMDRRTATEFSFLLAIPTLMGASLYDLYAMRACLTPDHLSTLAVGFCVAFVVSSFAFRPLVTCIERWGFIPFAWYRIALGCIVLFL